MMPWSKAFCSIQQEDTTAGAVQIVKDSDEEEYA